MTVTWGASQHMAFESWMEANHPDEFSDWEVLYAEVIDLYEYLETEHYSIINEWRAEQRERKQARESGITP